MENAALGVVEAIDGIVGHPGERVLVFCGPGNNGGDGLAVARHVLTRGGEVAVVLWCPGETMSPDAEQQLTTCRTLGIPIHGAEPDEVENALAWVGQGVVVDGLFGTGLNRALDGVPLELVRAINASSASVVAIDVPSGVDASSDRRIGAAIEADLTVTFAAPKVALVLPPACDHAGDVVVADLGVPCDWPEREGGVLHLLTASELAPSLGPRDPESHKGSHGHVLVMAGSLGMAGAAVLACLAAHRLGAGLVTLATPPSVRSESASATPETMTLDLRGEDPTGDDSLSMASQPDDTGRRRAARRTRHSGQGWDATTAFESSCSSC